MSVPLRHPWKIQVRDDPEGGESSWRDSTVELNEGTSVSDYAHEMNVLLGWKKYRRPLYSIRCPHCTWYYTASGQAIVDMEFNRHMRLRKNDPAHVATSSSR